MGANGESSADHVEDRTVGNGEAVEVGHWGDNVGGVGVVPLTAEV